MKTDNDQVKRGLLPKPISEEKLDNCNLNTILQKVLLRRGIDITNELKQYISPPELPNPEYHFKEFVNEGSRYLSLNSDLG